MAEFIESLRRDIPEFHQMYDDGLPTTPRALRDHFRRLETMFDIAVMTLTSYEVGAQLFALDLAYIRRQESMGIRRSVYRLSERYADEEDSIVRFLEDRKDALMFLRSQIVMKLPRLVIEHDGKRLGFVLHGKRDNFVGFKELTPEEPAKTVVSVKENSSCCIVM